MSSAAARGLNRTPSRMLDPAVLDRLRHDYERSPLPIRDLCRRHGVTHRQLAGLRRANHWKARPRTIADLKIYRTAGALVASLPDAATDRALLASLPGLETKAKATSKTKKDSGSTSHRIDLIRRLYLLYDAKLAEIETRVASGAALGRAEPDADLRAFGALLKHFEQLTDISDAAAKSERNAAIVDGSSRNDAERLRQDLVERFHRLRQSQSARLDAG